MTNRGLIEKALSDAARKVDLQIEVCDAADRKPGSPDIAQSIVGNIDTASLVVADILITQRTDSRCYINPNVGIELGYAAGRDGWENLVLLMNTNYGKPEDAPFDINHRAIVLTMQMQATSTMARSSSVVS